MASILAIRFGDLLKLLAANVPASSSRLLRLLVINSADRSLRVMTVLPTDPKVPREVEVTPLHKFLDLINRTPWNGIGFSGDGDFVIGGPSP